MGIPAPVGTPPITGLMPFERYWAMRPEDKSRYLSAFPQLYAAMRDDPRRFLELSRAGLEMPAPALALGVASTLEARQAKRKKAQGKPQYDAKNPAPMPQAQPPQPAAYDDEDDDYYDDEDDEPAAPYDIVDGVALLSISGPMTKKPTSGMWLFGGTSTLLFRRKLTHAEQNKRVGAILIDFDTPGGTVSGTADLADHISRVARTKIVEGFVPDLCASAGYWAISGVRRITVGRAALVGSLGVYMVVDDYSKMFETEGVTVHVIRAGQFKGAGETGTPVTDEQIADWQREVNDLNAEFMASVKAGRGMTDEQVAAVNTGQVWKGQELISLRLADEIGTYEDVLARLAREVVSAGLVSYPDALPGGANNGGGDASASLPLSGPGSGYPKTGDPATALIGSALERAEAERPAGMREAAAGSDRAANLQAPARPAQATGAGDGANPGGARAEDATDPAGDTTQDPATEGDPAPTGDGDGAGEDGTGAAGNGDPTDAGQPADDTPPANTAAGENDTEETDTMGDTQNNPAAGTATVANAALVAAIAAAGITTTEGFAALVAQAQDGKKARAKVIESIGSYATRLQGAEATEGVNYADMYGALPLEALYKIEGQFKGSYEAMMKHPAQNPGANGAAPTAPLGARITEAGGNLSPAIAAALQSTQAAQGGDPTGTGAAPVDPDAIAERFNKRRDGQAAAALGKKGV